MNEIRVKYEPVCHVRNFKHGRHVTDVTDVIWTWMWRMWWAWQTWETGMMDITFVPDVKTGSSWYFSHLIHIIYPFVVTGMEWSIGWWHYFNFLCVISSKPKKGMQAGGRVQKVNELCKLWVSKEGRKKWRKEEGNEEKNAKTWEEEKGKWKLKREERREKGRKIWGVSEGKEGKFGGSNLEEGNRREVKGNKSKN